MKDLLILLTHLLTTIARLLGSGGAKAVVADSLLMKQQLLIINRSMWCGASSPCITGQVLVMLDRRGCPSSGTPKTACGALICFGVNQFF